jgi:hypothetical protein
MIIHAHIPKKKKRKLTVKQKQLIESWDNILKQYPPRVLTLQSKNLTLQSKVYRRETPHYNSLNSKEYDTFKKDTQFYTGDKVKGIGTLHKSNAVPIFTDQEAIDQANMRR